MGIGHTRWATHGEPSARNAHPHPSNNGKFVVVHNGIVENFLELREELSAEGRGFQLGYRYRNDRAPDRALSTRLENDLAEAVRKALLNLRGAHGVVVMSSLEPDKIVAARIGNAGGVVIGLGEGEMFVASDIPAILEHTRQVIFLESGQMAVIQRSGVQVKTLQGEPVQYQGAHRGLGPDLGREGRVPPLHAEGNPRAGALADRYAGRAGGFRPGHGAAAAAQPDP